MAVMKVRKGPWDTKGLDKSLQERRSWSVTDVCHVPKALNILVKHK